MLPYLDTLIGFAVVMLAMSVLIMIATQMLSALLGSRGTNLRWGLETLFANANLVSGAEARRIAEDVLTHGMISDSILSRWRGAGQLIDPFLKRFHLASALHADELVGTLHELADGRYAGTPLAAAINTLLAEPSPGALRQIGLLARVVPAGSGAFIQEEAARKLAESAGKLEEGFHITMARVSQRFSMQLRLWTVLLSCALAFSTGTNSIRLMRELYSNGAFRESLVGAAPQVERLAEKVMSADAKTPQDAVAAMYARAVKGALDSAKVGIAPPASMASEDAAREWISRNIADEALRAATLAALPAALKQELTNAAGSAAEIRTILTKSSFDLLRFGWAGPFGEEWPGVLVTAALLSLGAPFWFNVLKTQANLRPALANRTATDRKSP